MLDLILTTVLLAPIPAELEGARAVLSLEETHLRIECRSAEPAILLVGEPGSPPRLCLPLGPGLVLDSDFARGALDGLRFELFLLEEGAWHTSGALELPRASAGATTTTWIEAQGAAFQAVEGGSIAALPGGASLAPRHAAALGADDGASEPPAPAVPLHVPLPEPSGKNHGDRPPEIGPDPLPDV
jgi:hypothetical protein